MTPGVKTRGDTRLGPDAPAGERRAVLPAVPASLGLHAATLRTRRGQTLALTFKNSEAALIVRSGVLVLRVTMAGELRQVIAVLYSGDMLRSAFVPPHAEGTLTAASAGEIWRLRWDACQELAASDLGIARYVDQAMTNRMARQAIHLAAIGQFDCEQRAATFLTELALRTGIPAPGGGMTFDMPLNRSDVADYLGLNADTLSRTMSRLKAAGLISRAERNRAVVRDLHALAALSPAAPSLFELHGFPEIGSCASPCCTPCARSCLERTQEEA